MASALPIRQNNATQNNNSQRANTSSGKGGSPTRPSIYPISPSANPLFADNGMGVSPMSFGMSFTGAGGMMKSWKHSFINQNGLGGRGQSFGDRNAFGSYKNANGSFGGRMDE